MKTVLSGSQIVVTLSSLVLAFLFCTVSAVAQAVTPRATPPPPPLPRPADGTARPERPLSQFEVELRANNAIKLAEKDHEDHLSRAREIGRIGKDLQHSLKMKASIDREFLKKVERLEKLTKKVRGVAGGDDQDVDIANRPSDIASAVTQIAEVSESLSMDVQNTPRQVVSASVIGNANVLLELIKMLRALAR